VNLISTGLDTRFTLTHVASIGSTNDAALAYLREGGRGHHWVVADEQTGGRGRLGRQWSSPKGNLYASLALRDPCSMAVGYQLGFVAALAIYEALVALGVPTHHLSLKWPNDVLLNDAKLSGILVEGGTLSDGAFGAVIGCGINVSFHPSDTPYPATDLSTEGYLGSVVDVFSALASACAEVLDQFAKGEGFGLIREQWIAKARGIGDTIRVRQSDGVLEGIFKGLDEQGKLLLERDGAVTPVIAGDVFYRD
jgi:BirA family biotin operon repressor/biotin-[acetyl-CoA-carboxylase] ligase